MMMSWKYLALLLAALPASAAFGDATGAATNAFVVRDYDSVEFSPAQGAEFRLPLRLGAPAHVSAAIHGPDGHLVRVLQQDLVAGDVDLVWDGRDERGSLVPDEAYLPVFQARFADGTVVAIDTRETSGGETIDDIPVRVVNESDIEYRLPAPARVLVRVGISGGPMLRELASWEARGAGSNIQRWDGRDAFGVERVLNAKGLKVLVTAFRLPTNSIIASGNTQTPYAAYHKSRGWKDPVFSPEDIRLERGGQRISRHAYQSRAMSRPPRVEVSLVGAAEAAGAGTYAVTGPVNVRVNIPKEDRWLLQSSGYEVAFFVDHVFLAEEETGYVPLTWRWDPAGLKPGTHTLTVNVSGFVGQVGVARAKLQIP